MKERPILMSAPMVRATLREVDPKTQTRRGVKWRDLAKGLNLAFTGLRAIETAGGWVLESDSRTSSEWRCKPTPCPYGQPGDRLWVRETFFAWGRWETRFSAKKGRDEWHFIDMTNECGQGYLYAADGVTNTQAFIKRRGGVEPMYWQRPSIHIPRWASRILLEVASVRVERLNNISEADAIAEGCTKNHNGYFWGGPHAVIGLKQLATAPAAFRDLWKSINGPGSWDANPWVWVVEFKRVSP